jgi:hypothetical protein
MMHGVTSTVRVCCTLGHTQWTEAETAYRRSELVFTFAQWVKVGNLYRERSDLQGVTFHPSLPSIRFLTNTTFMAAFFIKIKFTN